MRLGVDSLALCTVTVTVHYQANDIVSCIARDEDTVRRVLSGRPVQSRKYGAVR